MQESIPPGFWSGIISSRGDPYTVDDSGPGITAPETLFQPFQAGASGSGLGLYVSRSILRSYGGDLKFEPQPQGCTFAVELEAV